jgi:hypothetical protein
MEWVKRSSTNMPRVWNMFSENQILPKFRCMERSPVINIYRFVPDIS